MSLDEIISEYMPDDEANRAISEYFDACGHETRIKILCLLTISPLNVGEIGRALKMNQTTVSHQLRILRDRGMVQCKHRGKETEYSIADERFYGVLLRVIQITNAKAEDLVRLLAKITGDYRL